MVSGARRAQDFGGFGFVEFTVGKMPPTTNRLNYNVPGKGRTRTAKYREWRDSTGWELKLQKVRPIAGRVTIFVSLPDDVPNSPDLDNTAKALIDLLVAHRIVASDDKSCLRGLSLRWDSSVSCILVRIEQCPPPTEKFAQGNKSPFLVRAYRYPERTFAAHSGRRPINLNALSKKQKPIASAQHPSHWIRPQKHGGQTDDAVLEWTSEGWWHPAAVTKRGLLTLPLSDTGLGAHILRHVPDVVPVRRTRALMQIIGTGRHKKWSGWGSFRTTIRTTIRTTKQSRSA